MDALENKRNSLKPHLIDLVEHITEKSKGARMYVCPLCGSGTGKHKTGAFSISKDGLSWKCWACGEHGDIFNLVGLVENIPNHIEQVKKVAEMFGVQTEYKETSSIQIKKAKQIKVEEQIKQQSQESELDYSDFFFKAHQNITYTEYPQKRGLSEKTIEKFNLGFIQEWHHPKIPNSPASPRLIIPTSNSSYTARDTRATVPPEQQAYQKSKVGKQRIFNASVLYSSSLPVFVVEGEIDALSIIEAGGESIALGSVNMIDRLVQYIEKHGTPVTPLLLSLDNDQAGQLAQKKLVMGIIKSNMGVTFEEVNIAGKYKDANERLINDKEGLQKDIALVDTSKLEQTKIQLYREENSTKHYLTEFMNGISASVNSFFLSTGFTNLDTVLDGGVYEGLYLVGAISSLGKTSFVLEISDHIAHSGEDVLFFSLEMARTELIAKSVSRHTAQITKINNIEMINAKTVRGITNAERYQHYSEVEKDIIEKSFEEYGTYADNIFIFEGMGDIGVKQIREQIEKHIAYTGKKPLVVVDYLQILAPNGSYTDKQSMDKNVLELKRISRDFKLPIIAISSFNRASYTTAVSMEAFKESGALEYGSDVLLGLQLSGAGTRDFDVNKEKKEDPRKIELVVLKNRNGRTGDTIKFRYYPKFNYFIELE